MPSPRYSTIPTAPLSGRWVRTCAAVRIPRTLPTETSVPEPAPTASSTRLWTSSLAAMALLMPAVGMVTMRAMEAAPVSHVEPIPRIGRRAVRNVFEDVPDLARRLQRDRQGAVELRPVPVHLRQCQRLLEQKIPVWRVAALRMQHQRVRDVETGIGPEEVDAAAGVEDGLRVVEAHSGPPQRRVDPVAEEADRRPPWPPDEVGD